jgi:glycosyltransferase involved in cell wall biosynthesis
LRLFDGIGAGPRATAELSARLDWLGQRTDALEQREVSHTNAIADLNTTAAIEAVSRFVRHAELRAQPLVSVVVPTRDRPELLARAIESVREQRYENWELLVVDDGGQLNSRGVVEAAGDDRLSWSRIPASGLSATRNHALRAAKGELIAYLDDDDKMDPDWLHAVVWAFEQRPDVDVLYGAHVVENYLGAGGEPSRALPSTFLYRWSREALRQNNLTAVCAIAHRAGLAEAWFDEGLRRFSDWDLLVRLTVAKDPLVLPVVAFYYTIDGHPRMSNDLSGENDQAVVIARAESTHPLPEPERIDS